MAKPFSMANQKLLYFQMPLNLIKYGEQDKEHSIELLVNTPQESDVNW